MVLRSARIWNGPTQTKPVYEIRNAHSRAYSPTGRLHKPLETEIGHDKINPNPYAKRTTGRVAATPALQSNPVGSASCTPQACACRFWGYLHLGSARAQCAKPGRPTAPHLSLSLSQFACLTKHTPTPSSGNRSRGPSDPTSRMDPAKWRMSHV